MSGSKHIPFGFGRDGMEFRMEMRSTAKEWCGICGLVVAVMGDMFFAISEFTARGKDAFHSAQLAYVIHSRVCLNKWKT